jgi:DNA replication protein DnaC
MPTAHKAYAEWTPERLKKWALNTGPHTQALIEELISIYKIPEQSFRGCLGILRLGERYGAQRLENAARRGLTLGAIRYKNIESITGKLRHAKLREQACIEDLDYKASRGLSKMKITQLALCQWINNKENLLITGPTGTGKTYLACALAHKACRMKLGARYIRLPKLFQTLDIAKADGSYAKLLEQIAKTPLLVLDDWGVAPMTDANRRDFLELIDDRYQRTSTLITSQLPVAHWHDSIGDATLGDAILDRLIHNTHRIELTGDSMRKNKAEKMEKKEN